MNRQRSIWLVIHKVQKVKPDFIITHGETLFINQINSLITCDIHRQLQIISCDSGSCGFVARTPDPWATGNLASYKFFGICLFQSRMDDCCIGAVTRKLRPNQHVPNESNGQSPTELSSEEQSVLT